ncbi:MAG: ImmA/IrrE family metallo-endopeptidase [Verrucomicrobiota bacterium]|jgi:hypothetical protein
MNPQRIHTIFDLAEYFGLRIELLDLPANNAGYLASNDEYIAVNRNLPHCEQVFTAAHELCHYISDHKGPRRKYRSWLLNQKFENYHARLFVRFLRHVVNHILPIEREADMFAMSWLVHFGGYKLLNQFLERHPEKFWLCAYVTVNGLIKLPFRLVKSFAAKLRFAQDES